jgi:hypothetical protein
MYCIPCEYGKVYAGQMDHAIKAGVQQTYVAYKAIPTRYIGNGREFQWSTALTKHQATTVLVKTTTYIEHLIKEVTEIWLHPNNFNRDTRFSLSYLGYFTTNIRKYETIKKTLSERAND